MTIGKKASNLTIRAKLLQHAMKPQLSKATGTLEKQGHCWACGKDGAWRFGYVINDGLADTWEIDDVMREQFNCRESMFCESCDCSYRLRQLAQALVYIYGAEHSSLENMLQASGTFKRLNIAEINSCGALHQILQHHANLAYSEYLSKTASVPHEDLQALSYKDETFDLIVTSDTLEHVPDYQKAFKEIHRILKPGGRHIFTIPVVWHRQTRRRADYKQGGPSYLLPPSFHGNGEPDYLVFSEFGHDVIQSIEAAGFKVKLFNINPINLNDVSCVLVTTKVQ